jgi:hypothetical protein
VWPCDWFCEVDNEPPSSIEDVECFDIGFPAPERFYFNKLDAINKLILLSEIRGSCGTELQHNIILGYGVITLTDTDVSEDATTCVFGVEL